LVYLATPQRSYVVKKEEEINYELAYRKNKEKFIEDTLKKQIVKHKIQ